MHAQLCALGCCGPRTSNAVPEALAAMAKPTPAAAAAARLMRGSHAYRTGVGRQPHGPIASGSSSTTHALPSSAAAAAAA